MIDNSWNGSTKLIVQKPANQFPPSNPDASNADRHSPDVDVVLRSPQGLRFLVEITRLYLVVYGRPPDPGGLRAYVGHRDAGRSLRDLAKVFLASDEFERLLAGRNPTSVLRRHALGDEDGAVPGDQNHAVASSQPDLLADLTVSLVQSETVSVRLPVLPALYPDGAPLGDPTAYRIWLACRSQANVLTRRSVFLSFITVLLRPDPPGLRETLRSVLDQRSLDLEVIVVSRCVSKSVQQIAAADPRVRLVRAPFWYGAGRLYNHALKRCRGTFAGLVWPNEQLDDNAVTSINGIASVADIVLSDDDVFDQSGLRYGPRLGDAWDPDRMLATGRPGLMLARTSLLRAVNGMRSDGFDETNLILRAALRTSPKRIVHLADILLSREPLPTRPADSRTVVAARDYLRESGRRDCTVTRLQGTLRVAYPIPRQAPRASIIIATRDRADFLDRCVAGLLNRTSYRNMEIIIVDNGSTDGAAVSLLQRLSEHDCVQVLSAPGPFNWPALNNLGVSRMSGDVAVLLNNDTDVIDPGWLRELVSQAVRPDVGAVGAKLLYPDGSIQHAGVILTPDEHGLHLWRYMPGDGPGSLNSLIVTREVTAVTGACLAIRRDVYAAVGGCDAEHLPVTWNDVDLCLRVREHGLRVIWTPHARLLHFEQATRGTDDTPENQARFKREQAFMRQRWGKNLTKDPFFNANLFPDETGLRLRVTSKDS